ncbi:SDR family oxidoreductase [Actinoallomurus rhizosphaericola]|uniref:SDR family oxidoreductase n=1 Tax=Actinoallomurus rhizosphaericola TaxID=2952536 RepID=UPI002092402B|nr:SDR family oxidoreductase [Actinoallomurus rhizosphaericola]MCO6000065.1 SDR family oxidoreductase [Actinoallomurus rhizosphaericola]
MILVTGATGNLGSAAVGQLLARTDASQIAVLVRDRDKAAGLAQQGVSVRVGDYDDRESLAGALEGVDRVLLVASNQFQRREAQHRNVLDAVKAAGVELLGFTSRSLTDPENSRNVMLHDYFQTEAQIRQSGLPFVIFRNALYLDTLPFFLGGPKVFEEGIRLPTGQGKVAFALRREMGEAAANAMLDHTGSDRTYVLAAPHAYTFTDVAQALSDISGQTVTYESVTDEEFVARAVKVGVPEQTARHLVDSLHDVRDNQLDETSTDLERLLGHAPASLRDGLAELFSVPNPA